MIGANVSTKPQLLLLSLAVTLALAACKRDAATPDTGSADTTADPATAAYSLDEAKLPGVNRFTKDDLDPSKTACSDFNGYVNSKWLAANPIPGDRSSWGAFEMLAERSSAVQQQLAEQAAAKADATGIDKIVGDFYATGMDEAKINAQGIEPLKGHLAEIDALADTAGIAEYLRKTTA